MPDQTWDSSEREARLRNELVRHRKPAVVERGAPSGPVKCPRCGGAGRIQESGMLRLGQNCWICRGVGQVRYVPAKSLKSVSDGTPVLVTAGKWTHRPGVVHSQPYGFGVCWDDGGDEFSAVFGTRSADDILAGMLVAVPLTPAIPGVA